MLRSLLLAAAFVGTPTAATTEPTPPQPYAVLAQGLVEFTGGTYAWAHSPYEIGIGGSPLEVTTEGPTFLVASTEGAVVVTVADGTSTLLGAREAQFGGDAATTWTAIALAESGGETAPVRLEAIAVVPADTTSGTFTIGAGSHDVELRHLVVAGGASLQAPAEGPVFVLVTAGLLVDGAGTTVEPGGTLQIAAATQATNPSAQPAVVLMAVIGPALDSAGVDTTATPNPQPTTTSTTTTTTPPIDLDGDGLSDDEEAGIGTDHNDPDSDDDELTDGEEVETHGTDPLDIDTDDDELPDAGEIVTYGSDPLDPDTDDDGLYDIEPVNWGTGPTNPDTDDDGLNDGQEVNGYGSDPHVTDSDGDSLGDGDEVNSWGSDPTDTDSDDDTLVDGEEVNGTHTNPAAADTDGDTVDDGTEASNGTDPNDANDP